MRLLVTRPQTDADGTADALRSRGHEPIVVPLLSIESHKDARPDLADAQAVLITSANALRALAELSPACHHRVLAVGAATAHVARALGFEHVHSADGNTHDLAELAKRFCQPDKGRVIHVTGFHSSVDLTHDLQAAGFATARQIVYTAEAVARLPEDLMSMLGADPVPLDGVLLYSSRTAAILRELLQAEDLSESCHQLIAYCLSEAIAKTAKTLPFRQIRVARRPDEAALLDLLD